MEENDKMSPESIQYVGKLQLVDSVVKYIFKYGVVGFFTYKSISVLAGKITLADINLNGLFGDDLFCSLSVTVAACAIIWALIEKRIRIRRVDELHEQKRELEKIIDQNRQSSRLGPRSKKGKKGKK